LLIGPVRRGTDGVELALLHVWLFSLNRPFHDTTPSLTRRLSRKVRYLRSRSGLDLVGKAAPVFLDVPDAVITQDALHAFDRVTVAVKQPTDSFQQVDSLRPVIAAPTAPFHRFYLAEFAFPEPQHMFRHVQLVRNFADRAECIRRLFQ